LASPRTLSLSPDEKDASIYKTPNGEIAFIGSRLGDEGSSGRVKTTLLNAFLEAENLECLWLFVGERSAWPGAENDHAAWRRSEGLCWLEGNKPTLVTWKQDKANANGRSLAALNKSVATDLNEIGQSTPSAPMGSTAQ
jgi:hypothetical protein